MDRATGRPIAGERHLAQSLQDLLTTPVGTRVMRREYGCDLPQLIDAPLSPATVVDWTMAVAEAVDRWEPRFRLERVRVERAEPGRAELALEGTLDGRPLETGVVIAAGAVR